MVRNRLQSCVLPRHMLSNLCAVVCLVIVVLSQHSASVVAQEATAPTITITMEGRLTDASGLPIDTALPVVVKLFDSQSAGSLVFSETHASTPFSNGYYAIAVGSGTAGSGNLLDALRTNDQLWMTMAVNGEADMSPRIALRATPYAVNAATLGGNSYQKAAGVPAASGKEGDLYWDTAANKLYVNADGITAWTELGAAGSGGEVQSGTGSNSLIGGASLVPAPVAAGVNSLSIGSGAVVGVNGLDSIAIGTNAIAEGNDEVVIGHGASCLGAGGGAAVVIGAAASGTTLSIAIGQSATALDGRAAAVGYNARAGIGSAAFGQEARASSQGCAAIGWQASANFLNNVSVGAQATGTGNGATAIGTETSAAERSVSIGFAAQATGQGSVAIGANSAGPAPLHTVASGLESVAIGSAATATTTSSIALGAGAQATEANTARIGAVGTGTYLERKVISTSPTSNQSNAVCANNATFTLPAAQNGLTYTFVVTGASMSINGGTIFKGGSSGTSLASSAQGETVTVVAVGTTWYVISEIGSWTLS